MILTLIDSDPSPDLLAVFRHVVDRLCVDCSKISEPNTIIFSTDDYEDSQILAVLAEIGKTFSRLSISHSPLPDVLPSVRATVQRYFRNRHLQLDKITRATCQNFGTPPQ